MSPATCPAGHTTRSTDYCDTCGLPVATPAAAAPDPAMSPGSASGGQPSGPSVGPPAASASAPSSTPAGEGVAAGGQTCANCQAVNPADALFCEACGYDFTTGMMPRQEVPHQWVAEVWVDPGWADLQEGEDPVPSPGPPAMVPLRGRSLLVGRPSRSRNIQPDLDLSGDPGVSRRHAQLTTDGRRWWIEDLQSSNGTFVAPSSAPLPTEPIEPGQRREFGDDDRIYLGSWTRLVVREATPDETASSP